MSNVRLDVIDFFIDFIKDHEENLDRIAARLEAVIGTIDDLTFRLEELELRMKNPAFWEKSDIASNKTADDPKGEAAST